MTEFLFANIAVSVLDSGISAGATTLTVSAGHGARFPNPAAGQVFVIVVQSGTTREVMHCTGRAADVLTVLRAQEGTTAQAFPAGSAVQMLATAGTMDRFVQGPKTIAQNQLLGRFSSGTGIAEAIALGSGLEFSSGTLRMSNFTNYALKNVNNNFTAVQTVPAATAGGHAMNRDACDARYARPDQPTVFTGNGLTYERPTPQFVINATGTSFGRVAIHRSGSLRWMIGMTGDSETGSNAGSNFSIRRADDAGGDIGAVVTINRATGLVTTSGAVSLGADAVGANEAVRKSQMDAAIAASQTTANILALMAGAAVGAVGTYAFLQPQNTATYEAGATLAGSSLRYAGAITQSASFTNASGTPSGTWRCMGRRSATDYSDPPLASGDAATLWLRIS
jgi:hypothetical protein